MTKQLFVEQDLKVEGTDNAFTGGGIYKIEDTHVQEKLLATGKVHAVDFPKLEALELTVNSLVDEHKRKQQALKESPRYRDNEGEREYQLAELEKALEGDIERAKEDYSKELELMQRELALKAVQEVHPVDEGIQRWLNSEIAQLQYSSDIVTDLGLIELKVQAMNEQQLSTVLANAHKLRKLVEGKPEAEGILGRIVDTAKRSNKATGINLKLRQLNALKGHDIGTAYRLYKKVTGGKA